MKNLDVVLKVKNGEVKVLNSDNRRVVHVFNSNSNNVKSLLSELKKECLEYDLENFSVLDVEL